jgi:peroxiredoxin
MTIASKTTTLLWSATCLVASSVAIAGPQATAQHAAALPRMGDFALLDQNGVFHQLSRYGYQKAFVLMSYDASCASDGQAVENYDKLRKSFAGKDVTFVLLDSKSKDDRNVVRENANKSKVDFPILMDHSQLVTEMLGVRSSGSVVVLDPTKPQILYTGPASDDVRAIIDAKLAGSAAEPTTKAVKGCPIELSTKKAAVAKAPDYAKDVVPILKENCVMCHHDGGIGPWAMSSYEMVQGWSPMIREVVMTKRMPPMQVDPNISHFSNARYISDKDVQTLVHWADAGAPRGVSKEDPLAKGHYGTRTDWQLGQPDFIVKAPTHEIPSTGVLDYINETITVDFPEDKWVRAVQFIPGDPRVLHHLLSYVTGPRDDTPGGEASTVATATRFLEGYAPGKVDAMTFPKDTGVYIPKGHKISMQFHYTPNGKATSDSTILGLYFYDKPPKYEYLNIPVSGNFRIPAYARDYKTAGVYTFKEPVVVYGLRAHMHFRGHDMKFTADMPDGTQKELLSVPNYSYAWQPTYQLTEPVTLPAGTKVHVTGAFDNSQWNPANPDPSKELTFGLQSFDEMFIGYWSYTSTVPTNGG